MTKHLIWLSGLLGFSLLTPLAAAACGGANQSASEAKPPMASAPSSVSPRPATAVSDTTTSGVQRTDAQPSPSFSSTDQQDPTTKPMAKPIPPEPLDDTSATALPTTPDAPVPAQAPDTSDAWRTYRNEKAGYAVEYPSDWKVDEQTGTPGMVVATTFRPAGGGAGITVSVQRGEMDQEVSDIPNTRCKQVKVGGLSGKRCFDTVSFSVSTTLVGEGKIYTIAAPSKGLNQKIYQRLLDSFRPIS